MTGLATIQLTAPNPREAWASSAEGCNASTITASALWSPNLSTISELVAAPSTNTSECQRLSASCSSRTWSCVCCSNGRNASATSGSPNSLASATRCR